MASGRSVQLLVFLRAEMQNQKTWAEPADILGEAGLRGVYGSKTIYGKTFGFLGYGSVSAVCVFSSESSDADTQLGREFARMCSIFPAARIIAANTRGERKSDDTVRLEHPHAPPWTALSFAVYTARLRRYGRKAAGSLLLHL